MWVWKEELSFLSPAKQVQLVGEAGSLLRAELEVVPLQGVQHLLPPVDCLPVCPSHHVYVVSMHLDMASFDTI